METSDSSSKTECDAFYFSAQQIHLVLKVVQGLLSSYIFSHGWNGLSSLFKTVSGGRLQRACG